jgi:hypothetical protein
MMVALIRARLSTGSFKEASRLLAVRDDTILAPVFRSRSRRAVSLPSGSVCGFQILGSDKKVTAEKVMEQLDASHGRPVVVAIEKEGAEKALLEPLRKHAETFDVDVYRYGPVGKDYFPKVPVDPKMALKNDPRFFFTPLTLMWPGMENGKRGQNSIKDALMVYSTVRQYNYILGIDRQFTSDQIVKGLNDFYESWKPKEGEAKQPPAMILAAENWGAGMDYEALKAIAEERKVDLYLYYVCNFDGYPTSTENDKRLAELIP